MSTSLQDWKVQLGQLAPDERAELANFLLDSLDDGATIEAEWDSVASDRVDELKAGRVKGRDGDEFLADLRERYP